MNAGRRRGPPYLNPELSSPLKIRLLRWPLIKRSLDFRTRTDAVHINSVEEASGSEIHGPLTA